MPLGHWEALRNWNNVRQLLLQSLLFFGIWSIISAIDLLGFYLMEVQVLCHSSACIWFFTTDHLKMMASALRFL